MAFLQDWTSQGHLSDAAARKLALFAAAIQDWNPRINLTGFKSLDQIEEILVGESLRALSHLQTAGRSILDFGSGAGIPGLAWAIAEPACSVTSLEIRQKKVTFQKEMVRTLDLQNIEIVGGRFPDAVEGRAFDLIVTRAIRFSSKLWQDARRLLSPGGRLIQFASPGKEHVGGWKPLPVSERTVLLIYE